MFFSRTKEFSENDISLITNFLEQMIGENEEYCKEIATAHDFILLDSWNNKMGFVKEIENTYVILSLHFKKGICTYYQVIAKKEGGKWAESTFYDYDSVREAGIIEDKRY